jgi:hypothetical protein
MSDLFGIHPGTAHSWAKLAQTSWTEYLAACQATQQVMHLAWRMIVLVAGNSVARCTVAR